MTRSILFPVLLILTGIITACVPSSEALPTLMILPTDDPAQSVAQAASTATPVPSQTATATVTDTPTMTLTPTATASSTPTKTPTQTDTPPPTMTFTPSRTPTQTATPTPDGDAVVSGESGVNLRSGPSTKFNPPVALLQTNTVLYLTAISSTGNWYQVQTDSGQEGWVYGNLIDIHRQDVSQLPSVYVPVPTDPPAPPQIVQLPPQSQSFVEPNTSDTSVIVLPPAGSSNPPAGNTGASVPVSSGNAPPVSTGISARVRQIYQDGLSRGNNPRMFAKIGDSLTAAQPYLLGYGSGQYNLGGYGYLQDTISYFSSSAFSRDSIAAEPGFNAAAILSSIWAPPGTCQPNESPMNCEYRLTRPSIALIMFGSVDVQLYSVQEFQGYMSQIVQQTINQGIVPVLSTFPNSGSYYPSESEAFNGAIRSVAAQYQIPLIDLRPAIMGMSNGIKPDGFHLTERGTIFIDLNGEQNTYGLTMRNLMALQMLDDLRRGLGMN